MFHAKLHLRPGIITEGDKTVVHAVVYISRLMTHTHTHTHPFNGPLSGTTQVTSTRKVEPIWILLKQETVSGSGISWAVCKSAPRSRQITTPASHHSVFYRPDAFSATQPTASKPSTPMIKKIKVAHTRLPSVGFRADPGFWQSACR